MNKTYDEFINDILKTRGRNGCGDEYHEAHHIVPKCVGGNDDGDNLIDLFAREHFEAHRLLALENPENEKLIYAWHMMAYVKDSNQERIEISAEEYEECRIAFSKMRSEKVRGKNNPMYGVSAKDRMGEEAYELWKKNCGQVLNSPEVREKQRLSCLGKKYSDEVNKKKGRSGKDHHMYGKHISDNHKEAIRMSHIGKHDSEETKQKKRDAMTGDVLENMKKNQPNRIPVMCIETGQIFISVKDAAKQLNVCSSSIYKSINGGYKYKTPKYNFARVEKEEGMP